MESGLETDVLRAVSRSFYLSLRLLPKPMRRAAGIGYLLARASDTIADAEGLELGERVTFLEGFGAWVKGGDAVFFDGVLGKVMNEGERVLLSRCGEVMKAMEELPENERDLVREVLGEILSGQRMDLEVFAGASDGEVICLRNEGLLEDYTYRVAGCVGAFWTKLGYEVLGEKFSREPMEEMVKVGVAYGKGLQLVNILRDLREDMTKGRCYLPVRNVNDEEVVMREFGRLRGLAVRLVEKGFVYSKALESRRLRVASVLPAMIGAETLDLLEGVSFSELGTKVKVRRGRVYGMLIRAWMGKW